MLKLKNIDVLLGPTDAQKANGSGGNTPKAAKLTGRPFTFEHGTLTPPRAWKPSKPTAITADQITVALGTIAARIAGSLVTYPMDVQIVFADKTATPDVVLRQPWLSAPGGRGGKPLFEADDDAGQKELADNFGSLVDQYLDWYSKQPAENRIDFKTINYEIAATLIKSKAGSVKRALPR